MISNCSAVTTLSCVQVKIGDFGFTRRLARDSPSLKVARITHPRWVAPEVRWDTRHATISVCGCPMLVAVFTAYAHMCTIITVLLYVLPARVNWLDPASGGGST